MSYPPTADPFAQASRRGAHGSSADQYATTSPAPEAQPMLDGPPRFADDNHYPERQSPAMSSSWSNQDPYGRYDNHESSLAGHDSVANLSMDGQSRMGLHSRQGSNLGYGYSDKNEYDDGSSARRAGALGAGAGAVGGTPGKGGFWSRLSSRAKKFIIIGLVLALLLIAAAVAIPVAITQVNDNKKSELAADGGASSSRRTSTSHSVVSAPSGVPTGTTGSTDWRTAPWGGDGSTIYMEDGTSFQYNNTFGGFWNAIPFNDSARAQADVPALNEEWDYDLNLINGVNLGGWLTIEPFIVPGLFEPFNSNTDDVNGTNLAIDEWTLCEQLGDNRTAVITEHYETFITERDFAEIAAAGLNWIRLPVPYWIIEVWDDEPFVANVGWTYFLKAITWARKYGLRINLDFHAVPGSQNGYNHSSKQGSINFLGGIMGIANAQRTMNYIRTFTEFISQPEYKNVIPMFSTLNEPSGTSIGVDTLRHFYYESYNVVRDIGGFGKGNGPFISWHDAFTQTPIRNVTEGGWNGFLPGLDRVALDTHPYLCFSEPNNYGLTYQASLPCSYWGTGMNTTAQQFGLSIAGEWSLAINDCGKWLNNVGNGQRYEGTYYIPGNKTAPLYKGFGVGACDAWTDYDNYNQTVIDGLRLVATGHMDAFRHWFYWTWKIGYSSSLGRLANPAWNYKLGLERGWIPDNPRTVVGACSSLITSNGFSIAMSNNPAPTLSAWMTGGDGAGTMLDSAMVTEFSAWPPTALGGTTTRFFPTYTATAERITLAVSTPTSYPSGYSATPSVGDGWFNSDDSSSYYTEIAGCSYVNPWSGAGAPVPTTRCTGTAARMKRSPAPTRSSSVPTATPTTPPVYRVA